MQIFQSNSSILHILSEILDNQGKIEGKIHLSFSPEGEAFQSLFSHIDGKIRDGYGVDGYGGRWYCRG
jgi:hypothetical protein